MSATGNTNRPPHRSKDKPLALIPAFNEADGIARVVTRLRELGFEVLVVNDCSVDDTERHARQAGAVVISHSSNMGYGCALQTGYRYALENGFQVLVQLDGDGQHEVDFARQLADSLVRDRLDLVIGSRFLAESQTYRIPLARRLGQRFFQILLRLTSGLNITDSTSGYQALTAEVLRFFVSELFPDDYPDANILLLVHRLGFRIGEIPVAMHAAEGGVSMHAGILKPTFYMIRMTLSVLMASITTLPERLKK